MHAHLVGGIPKQEVADRSHLFVAHGFDPMHVFVERDARYYDFGHAAASKADLERFVTDDLGVAAREGELISAFDTWWDANAKFIIELPETKALMTARATLLDSFVNALSPVGLLDRYQVAGVIASWWGDVQFDLSALAAGGFSAVIDGWITTITTALDDKDMKGKPFEHRLVRALLPEYIDAIEAAAALRAELDATVKSATRARADADEGEDDDVADLDDGDDELSADELVAVKKALTAAKSQSKALERRFVAELAAARAELSSDQDQQLTLRVTRSQLADHVAAYVGQHRQLLVDALEHWWNTYSVSLTELEAERTVAKGRLEDVLVGLGYA